MKNPRIFSIATGVAALAMLVSCSSELKEEKKSVVRFQVASSDTKSNINTSARINRENSKFLIDLFDSDTKEVVRLGSVATCVNNDGVKEWELDEITYWEGRTLDAWARFPITLNGSLGLVQSQSGDKATGYIKDDDGHVVRVDENRTSESFNFLTYYNEDASPRMDATLQDDLLFACTKGCSDSKDGGRIKLDYSHALAAVYFKIAADDGESEIGDNVVLNSISINNIKRAGSCVYRPDAANPDERFTWDTGESAEGLLRNKGSYVQTLNKTLDAASAGNIIGGTFEDADCFFVIPQTMDPDASLTINWSKNGEQRDARTAIIAKDSKGRAITWKPGYKYLYSLRIKKHGAEIDVDVQVLPWNVKEIAIDFEESVSSTGNLVFSNAVITDQGSTTLVTYDSRAIKGTFTLSKPEGAQWLVSITNNDDFQVYTRDEDGNMVTQPRNVAYGPVDGTPAVFFLAPKPGIDPMTNHTTKVKVSVMAAGGSTISADQQINSEKYTILVPKKN